MGSFLFAVYRAAYQFKMSSIRSMGGITNDAFLDDEDDVVDINITYAKWMNKHDISECEMQLELKNKNREVVRELSDSFKQYSQEDSDDSSDNDIDFDIYQRPTKTVRRADIIASLSSSYREGSLGKVCSDRNCPYNQWLYHGEAFPEHRLLKKWESELKKFHEIRDKSAASELKLNPHLLKRKLWERSTPVTSSSSSSSQRSPSFSYFQYNNLDSYLIPNPPGTPSSNNPPPYSWRALNSPSTLSSSYPIVTLPRSQRKKKLIDQAYNMFKGEDFRKVESVNRGRPSSTTSTSSCSCTSTSCSSCSSSYEMSEMNSLSIPPQDPFLQKTIGRQSRRKYRLVPRCDMTCYIITSFILLSLAALASVFIYIYLFAPVEREKHQ